MKGPHDPSRLRRHPDCRRRDPDDRSGNADEVQIFNEADELIEVDKVVGPTRLTIVFACPPQLRGRAKFRYYFETFGDLVVP